MRTMIIVDDAISLIKNGEEMNVSLITACSGQVIYNNFYSNYPDEFKKLDVTQIEFQDGNIILYVL